VLVGGEAGIGKTSLVRAFCDRHGGDARALWGACDALRTPRPLGPLLDIAREAGGELAEVVAAEPTRHRLFRAFLDLLDSAGWPARRRWWWSPTATTRSGPGTPCGRPSATWPRPGGSTALSSRR
jgi:hypothetical protein